MEKEKKNEKEEEKEEEALHPWFLAQEVVESKAQEVKMAKMYENEIKACRIDGAMTQA